MKRSLLILLLTLSVSSIFAGGDAYPYKELYVTKSCPQEYFGYFGFGAGWNYDKNQFKTEFHSIENNYAAKYSGKGNATEVVGKFFLGYSFYSEQDYSLAIEAGIYSSGKTVSETEMTTYSNGDASTIAIKGSAKRQPAYYLAFKPKFEGGSWWANLTLGIAGTSFDLENDIHYNVANRNAVNMNNLGDSTKSGFVNYGLMAGAGVGTWLNPSWALSLDYDYINWANESSKTYKDYNNGVLVRYIESTLKSGSYSHFVSVSLRNNFSWLFG